MSNEENKEVLQDTPEITSNIEEVVKDTTKTTNSVSIEKESDVVNETTEEEVKEPIKVKQEPPTAVCLPNDEPVKRKVNGKRIGVLLLVAVAVIGATSGGAYMLGSRSMDKKIEAQKQQMEKDTEDFFKQQEGSISVQKVPQEVLEKAKSIEVKADDLPQELVEPKAGRPFKNDKGWMLVDTDNDGVGDSYWDVSVDDVKSGKYGRMYLYSPVNRRYKQIKIQNAVPEKGIKEKWISVLDMDQIIPPQFLLPIQFYQDGKGTIVDWSLVDKVLSDAN